jgi:hypothetical protein
MQNVNLKLENLNDGGNVITIREGKALDLKPPEKILIAGDIKTVASFITQRMAQEAGKCGLQTIDKATALVIVNKEELTIELLLNPEDHFAPKVLGTLLPEPELEKWGINTTQTFTKEQLVKLIKFNKMVFKDPTKHAEMLLAFQKVSSTVNIKTNESSDERGNKERAFVKEVTSNAPTEFILEIPIFKGFPASSFRVEVCLDVTEGSVRFWFESVELNELQKKQTTSKHCCQGLK